MNRLFFWSTNPLGTDQLRLFSPIFRPRDCVSFVEYKAVAGKRIRLERVVYFWLYTPPKTTVLHMTALRMLQDLYIGMVALSHRIIVSLRLLEVTRIVSSLFLKHHSWLTCLLYHCRLLKNNKLALWMSLNSVTNAWRLTASSLQISIQFNLHYWVQFNLQRPSSCFQNGFQPGYCLSSLSAKSTSAGQP